MIRPLTGSDLVHLRAAEGWLELGNWAEANGELDHISARRRAHPHVLNLGHDVFASAGRWTGAVEIARTLTEMLPNDPLGFLRRALALHKLGRTQEAWDVLRPLMERFPWEWLIQYNLACYACELGKFQEARDWLGKAIEIAGQEEIPGQAKHVKTLALEDPDLEPLWRDLGKDDYERRRGAV